MKPSVTAIIPAYNEAGNIEATVRSILNGFKAGGFENYEVLIFNDCSQDNTGEIADRLARENTHIKVIHNKPNKGFGYNYQKGIELAQCDYVVMFPGDNVIIEASVQELLSKTGQADIIISYVANPEIRAWSRRFISNAFTILVNFLFGLRVIYYNGSPIIKTSLVRIAPRTTSSFAYMAEILVQLIKAGASYIEVAAFVQPRAYGKSTALKAKNFYTVSETLLRLFGRVYFTALVKNLREHINQV